MSDELGALLTLTYAWLKAGHVIFVIFWIAGLFMLPRFYVYHQEAAAALPEGLPVQGNLDPLALIAGGEALETAVRSIISAFEGRPHIFNLGHGIVKETPIAHVERLLALVRGG